MEAGSYLVAFERCTKVEHPRGWIPGTEVDEFPDLDAITIAQVLEGVDLAATAAGITRSRMLIIIEAEIKRAMINRVMRQNDDRHRTKVELVDALALGESDFALYERWVNHLDKEYDRLVKRIELAQPARGGALPPPIRVHRSED